MTTTDPLSLTEAKRLAGNGDTPAYLLESVEGGERLGRYSFLGVGPRRLLEVRDGLARTQTRPVTVGEYHPDLPIDIGEAPDPLAAIRAFVPRRRVRPTEGM